MRPPRRQWPFTNIAGSIPADEAPAAGSLPRLPAYVTMEVWLPMMSCHSPSWGRGIAIRSWPSAVFCCWRWGWCSAQTVRSGFVNYDDGLYVYENAHVLHGLSPREIVWAFTRLHAGYWIPLTWISFMLDSQLYGLEAGGYHLTNVLLHAATTILLFLVLEQMTGRFWPCALVAALFAVHPLHVESVAWVTERKDLLSGLFFLLALRAYLGYVRGPSSRGQYAAVMIFFVLGLLAKPMLVTFPLVLLLLDYWPLGRFADSSRRSNALPLQWGRRFPVRQIRRQRQPRRFPLSWPLVIEKLPLFLLAAVFCLLTAGTEGQGGGRRESFPFSWQVGNALVSYVAYLGQFFYPLGLAAFYPHPEGDLPVWKVAAAAVVLACISAAALASGRRHPYLLMGWLWYLVTLLPVIGLMQVGGQAMADRFTYVTQIGLYIALAWGAADVLRSRSYRGGLCGSCVGLGAGGSDGLVRGVRRLFGRIRRPSGPMRWLARREISWPTTVWAAFWPSGGNSTRP